MFRLLVSLAPLTAAAVTALLTAALTTVVLLPGHLGDCSILILLHCSLDQLPHSGLPDSLTLTLIHLPFILLHLIILLTLKPTPLYRLFHLNWLSQ